MTRDATPSQTEIEAVSLLKDMEIDHDSMAALSNIFRVATRFRSLVERDVLSQCNLSFSTFTILWVVWIRGPREFKELAKDVGVSKGTMTGLIKGLTKRELVSRAEHPTDNRRLIIKITPTGRSLVKRLFPKVNLLEARLTEELKVKEKQEVAKLLRIILNTNLY